VNAYEVKASIGVIAGNTVSSMPERLECEVLQKVHYTNTLTFTFTFFGNLDLNPSYFWLRQPKFRGIRCTWRWQRYVLSECSPVC